MATTMGMVKLNWRRNPSSSLTWRLRHKIDVNEELNNERND